MKPSVVYIASDHGGFAMKKLFVAWLGEQGYAVQDLGTDSDVRCDAYDFALKVAEALKRDAAARGVLICKTGQAMAMTVNRFRHIRAAVCANGTMARLAREHNDANVLALGAEVIGAQVALDCLKAFLKTEFLGGKYEERRDRLTRLGGL